MKTWTAAAVLVFVLLLAGLGYMFWVQNSAQVVTVSIEFWGLGRRGHTWKAPELMAICFAAGAVMMGMPWVFSSWRSRSRIRRLEQQIKVGGGDTSSSWR